MALAAMGQPSGFAVVTEAPNVLEAPRPARVSPWRIALTLILTAGLVALLFTQVSVSRIVGMIRGADLGLVGLAVLAYAASYVGRTWRWRLLTPGRDIGWPALIGVSTVHNFMVRALPSKLGEGSYLVLMKARGVPGTEALAGLVVARIYDMMVSVLFFTLAVFLTQSPLRGNVVANTLIAAAVLAGAGALVLRGSLIVRFVRALAGRLVAWGRVPGILRGRGVRVRLEKLEGHLETLQSGRQAPLIFAHTLLIWGPSFAMTWWLLAAFGHPLDFWGTVFASTLGIVATLLPVSTLGNFGTQEMGWTLGMTLLGVDRETAIATGFSTHLVGFALAGLFALVGAPLNALAANRRR